MTTEEKIKRRRRQKDTMQQVRVRLVKLILDSIGDDDGIIFADIRAVYNEFGLSHLSDASIRRDIKLAGIKYTGLGYVLDGMKDPQQTSLKLSKLIHCFDIFNPIEYYNIEKGNFEDLFLVHLYLRLKADVNPKRILQFKFLLQKYLNQVNNLYREEPINYPLERYFFDINESNQTLCFLINNRETLNTFSKLLTTISECNPNKSHKRIKLFYIEPQ